MIALIQHPTHCKIKLQAFRGMPTSLSLCNIPMLLKLYVSLIQHPTHCKIKLQAFRGMPTSLSLCNIPMLLKLYVSPSINVMWCITLLLCLIYFSEKRQEFTGTVAAWDGNSGEITSPNFPDGYALNDETFTYVIKNLDPYGHVRVTFDDWHLASASSLQVSFKPIVSIFLNIMELPVTVFISLPDVCVSIWH